MLMEAVAQSMKDLRGRISAVRYDKASGNYIRFSLDGRDYRGQLQGRNADLILTGDHHNDAGCAARCIFDGDAVAVGTAEIHSPSVSTARSRYGGGL